MNRVTAGKCIHIIFLTTDTSISKTVTHKVYFCCARHAFWTSARDAGKLAIHARDIIDYCQPSRPHRGSKAHRLRTNGKPSIAIWIETRCVLRETKLAKGRTHAFPTTCLFYSLLKNNTCNLMLLCLRQRLLLTGLRWVSKHDNQTQHMVLQQSLLQDHSCADRSEHGQPGLEKLPQAVLANIHYS
jgi:hypothetical protein